MGGRGERDGLSARSPVRTPASSASSQPKDDVEVELELRLLEALETYPPSRLRGMHRHFVLYGLMEFLQKSFGKQFSSDEVLQLLDRFFNLEVLEPDDEEEDDLNQVEDFSLPQNFLKKEEL